LDLVGSITTKKGGELFAKSRQVYDPEEKFVFYHGKKSQEELLKYYHSTNGFIFASSCETFGQILLESMASGLPIACSDRSALPEVLGKTGHYFDPEDSLSIFEALKELLDSARLREELAANAFERAQTFSWEKCADETFGFIQKVFKKNQNS
jgi:glycosyltransferase involved in cell wall biosynthesis